MCLAIEDLGVIVPTTLYGAESWGVRSAERESECSSVWSLRSLGEVSRMDRVRNEEVRRRAGAKFSKSLMSRNRAVRTKQNLSTAHEFVVC